jgi:hypothetical protein
MLCNGIYALFFGYGIYLQASRMVNEGIVGLRKTAT